MNNYHVKKGDAVTVNSGFWKGETGTIVAVLKGKDRVVISFASLSDAKKDKMGKRTVKKSQQNPQGGMVERSVSVHVSNVALTEEAKQAKQKAREERLAAKAAKRSQKDGVK